MVNGILTPHPLILNEAPQAQVPANMCKRAWMMNDHCKRPQSNGKLISRGKKSVKTLAPLLSVTLLGSKRSRARLSLCFCLSRLSRRIQIVFIITFRQAGSAHGSNWFYMERAQKGHFWHTSVAAMELI